jgi:hypothetical protein
MEVSGQLHAPAALSPGKEPLVPIGYIVLIGESEGKRPFERHRHSWQDLKEVGYEASSGLNMFRTRTSDGLL